MPFVINVYFQVWRSNCQEPHHLPLFPLPSLFILCRVFRVMFHSLNRFLSAHQCNTELTIPLRCLLSFSLAHWLSLSFSLSWFLHKSNRITTHCSAKDRHWVRQENRFERERRSGFTSRGGNRTAAEKKRGPKSLRGPTSK